MGFCFGCLKSQQRDSARLERICSDNVACCHSEMEVADPVCYLIVVAVY